MQQVFHGGCGGGSGRSTTRKTPVRRGKPLVKISSVIEVGPGLTHFECDFRDFRVAFDAPAYDGVVEGEGNGDEGNDGGGGGSGGCKSAK